MVEVDTDTQLVFWACMIFFLSYLLWVNEYHT
jgi:hypothetical protein